MKRFAPWLIALYAFGAILGGGLHLWLESAPDPAGCTEASSHVCGHSTPVHEHDEHTCPTCQGLNLKDAVATGGAPAVVERAPAGAASPVVPVLSSTAACRPFAARAPPVSA